MDTKAIADLFVTATGKIEFYWNFYTLTLLALVGWLVSTDQPLGLPLKGLISIGYVAFAAMNLLGLWGAYTFAEAVRKDLLDAGRAQQGTMINARRVLEHHSYADLRRLAPIIHGVLGVAVLAVIWFGRSGP